MKKHIISGFLFIYIFSMIFMMPSTAYTAEEITELLNLREMPTSLSINNKYIGIADSLVFMENNIYMPIREAVQLFNYGDLKWDGESNTIQITDGINLITIALDEQRILKNGMVEYIENPIILLNGTSMIELSMIEELFDCQLEYSEELAVLSIIKDNLELPDEYYHEVDLEELLWLSRIVTVEARNLPFEGKLAIANVVLNRKKSSIFPDSVYDVIFEVDYYVQFPPAHKSGFSDSVPSEASVKAALTALNGENNISTCLYFNNSPFRSKTDDLYKIIEGEYFYY